MVLGGSEMNVPEKIPKLPGSFLVQLARRSPGKSSFEDETWQTNGRGYQVAGRPKPQDVGQIALLEKLQISPSRQWERVYAKVEQELCLRVLFGSVRVIEAPLAEYLVLAASSPGMS